jgi:choloylglycine hydrolase
MIALTQAALPVTGADAGLNLAMTIIDNVEIPVGASRDKAPAGITYDRTAWTIPADLSCLRYYFCTYGNKNLHYVDLAKALAGAKGVVNILTALSPDYPDVTVTGKPAK